MKAEASWESRINILSNRDANLQLYRPGNILPFRLFGALCLALCVWQTTALRIFTAGLNS